MRLLLHILYELLGHFYALIANMYYNVRDNIAPPNEKAVLFIAHPDDDVLFFHTFIKRERPYVVLLTTGGVLKRVIPFQRAMHFYKVRYRTFDMNSRAVEKEELISRRIQGIINRSSFEICATHNYEGEYGHVMHRCIHRCVSNCWKGDIYVPYNGNEIKQHPLSQNVLEEKHRIIKTFYKGEYPILQRLEIWIEHEGLRAAG